MKRFTIALSLLLALSIGMAAAIPALAEEGKAKEEKVNHFLKVKTVDVYGKEFDPAIFEGKPIMINVWADWCGPCLHELPFLENLAKRYEDKITIIGLLAEGVKADEQGNPVPDEEKMQSAAKVLEEKGITYPCLVPEGVLLYLMEYVQAFPTTFFIDAEGTPQNLLTGANSEEGWAKIIDEFLLSIETKGHE